MAKWLTDIAGQVMNNLLSGKAWWCINLIEVGLAAVGGAVSALAIEGVPPWVLTGVVNMMQTIATTYATTGKFPSAKQLQAAAISGMTGGAMGGAFGNSVQGLVDVGELGVASAIKSVGESFGGGFTNTLPKVNDAMGVSGC